MAEDPFERDHAPPIGAAERLAPGVRVVTAPNAGPMTFTGTRTYLVGEGQVAVIDPGPDDARHREAVARALGPGETVVAVLVTHAHRDHSEGAAAMGARLGAEVLAHGDPVGARAPGMARLAGDLGLGGGEGLVPGFAPDRRIGEGEVIAAPGLTLAALATPGHTADHLSFVYREGAALFSGDLVMGWSTTMISPPDGDLAAYRESLGRLRERGEGVYYPGHGAAVTRPGRLIGHMLAHRAAREAQVLDMLAKGPARVPELVEAMYRGLDPKLRGAAARTVLAHLVDLAGRERVAVEGSGAGALYGLA
ncbi:MBL fold metallo-hydrolase [Amaricoccus solimangrovi]|uniref:MBL fold metallo-hydrolase n=1 Tax=Amaricoccus solimangrovi TaxID=2589815 RepID=A0A501WP73_9RHOB|nr:MBL fold metallo-hydrolase [Amaricoccus solimangrovi]TPE50140.1 MBL fold metallo-hydrolase [Amaricoccus solimangrovi]